MNSASFQLQIKELGTDQVLLEDEFDGEVLSIGKSSSNRFVFKDLPDLAFEWTETDDLVYTMGRSEKLVEESGHHTLPNGWKLHIDLDQASRSVKLTFIGKLVNATQEAQPSPQRNLVLKCMGVILALVVISIPWWMANVDKAETQSSIERVLENTLSPGPLHEAHVNATQQCSDCHQDGFDSIAIEPCLACHTMKRHLTREQTGVHPLCVACHKEHETPSILVHRDSRLCTQCHAEHATLEGVLAKGITVDLDVIQDFPATHPEFDRPDTHAPAIAFSHAVHLNDKKVREANKGQTLACQSCHEPGQKEHGFKAIKMEAHCGDCHEQRYTNQAGDEITLKHGDMLTLMDLMKQTQVEQKDRNRTLIKNCQACHNLSELTLTKPSLISPETVHAWSVKQTLNPPAFKDMRFSHSRHQTNLECVDCHVEAPESEHAKDNLLPAKAACASCHQSLPEEAEHLKTECADCHTFHTVPWD